MDKILLIIGLLLAVIIIVTGGFGVVSGLGIKVPSFSGGSGPLATGSGINEAAPPTPIAAGGSAGSQTPKSEFPRSTTQGRIKITSVTRAELDRPQNEYVAIRYESGTAPVIISGWEIGNTLGNRFPLPLAEKLPYSDAARIVRLLPGETAYLHTGASPIGASFMENACTGYFNQNHSFNPTLGESCPRPEVSRLVQFRDPCLRFLEANIRTCRVPNLSEDAAFGIGQECVDFVNDNLNYSSCVREERNRPDFYRGIWHLYLGRPTAIYRNLHDKITLYDQFGLIVDSYQY